VTRVLIVDDHERVRRGVREALDRTLEQAVFGEAGGAAEALRQVEQEPWDVVLLDLSLPDRSGMDTLRELRRLRPGLPVLVMSMHPEGQYAAAALAAGAAAYLPKGSDPEVIAAAVRGAVAAPAPDGGAVTGADRTEVGLARLLHDDLAQALAALKINLQLTRGAEPAQLERRLTESLAAVDSAIASVRRLAERLGSGQ
jgi:two-component system, NarL family, invasion response regulator UvrY